MHSVRPALVICDLNLPGISGSQAVQPFARARPMPPSWCSPGMIHLNMCAPLHRRPPSLVCARTRRVPSVRAVRRAAAGRRTVCGNVWEALIGTGSSMARLRSDGESRSGQRGLPRAALYWPSACPPGASPRTWTGLKAVEKYRTTLMRRLGTCSAAAVTRYAVEQRGEQPGTGSHAGVARHEASADHRR